MSAPEANTTRALALSENHLHHNHGLRIMAAERAEQQWSIFVVLEYKNSKGGGRVYQSITTDLSTIKQALAILGIEL